MSKKIAKQPEKSTYTERSGSNINFLYIIAFIEGGAVMAIELAGAKMIAPFYGTSLFVWASVLAVTLGGLTTGYFLGGWATYRFTPQKLLFWELLIGTLAVALMPFLALKIMPATSGMGMRMGSLVSALAFMIVPLACMGMISPTLIQLNNKELKSTGKTAGTIYAVSTIGGILMTLLMGFYFLPEWGIRNSVYLTTFLLGMMPVLLMAVYGRHKILTTAGLTMVLFSLFASQKPFDVPDIPLKFLYKSDGILGQVAVLETPDPVQGRTLRNLFVNHIPQTFVDVDRMPISEWGYPHRISKLASIKPPGSKVLLIGLGGGSLAMEFKQLGFNVDIVELDERIPQVAQQYFAFDPTGMGVFIDDGRHFIQNTNTTYDLIVIDVLNGEVQPNHIFTKESFAEMLKVIHPKDGLIIINSQGYVEREHGKGTRSIFKTLLESGYKVQYYYAGENNQDIHFMASMQDIDFQSVQETRLNECCRLWRYHSEPITTDSPIDTSDAFILTDDKPQLELLNNFGNEEWRTRVISTGGILEKEKLNRIPFFF